MSNSNNYEKKGEENNHNLARLVKEIFNSDGKVIQATEGNLVSEDLIHDPLGRIIIRTINDLFEFMEPYLMEVIAEYFKEEKRKLANARNKLTEVLNEYLEQEERKDNTSQQFTSFS